MSRLQDLRAEIATIDGQIIELLAARAAKVGEVWEIKEAQGIPRFDFDQEQRKSHLLLQQARERGLEEMAVLPILEAIIGKELRAKT